MAPESIYLGGETSNIFYVHNHEVSIGANFHSKNSTRPLFSFFLELGPEFLVVYPSNESYKDFQLSLRCLKVGFSECVNVINKQPQRSIWVFPKIGVPPNHEF